MTALDGLREALEQRAFELGFARIGVAHVQPLERDALALRRWLAAGHHGSMTWMNDTADVRLDPTHPGMLPSAARVVALVTPYQHEGPPVGPHPGRVARYAEGRDYHNVLGKRVKKLAKLLREAGFPTRGSVDSLPVLERSWAQRAGVGFIGKNCCLIVPGLGSHVLLSTLVTAAPLPVDEPMEPRCGSCRACLDACPTDAFVESRSLDARRCVSYLTIEHDGPIPEPLRAAIGDRFFGCDDCQDVCPFNRTAPPPAHETAPFAPSARFVAPDAPSCADVLEMDEEQHLAWAHGSPLRRPGRASLARNAATVLGNRGDRRHLPVLRRAAETDPSDAVRDAATWAIGRITDTAS
ncbi:MAG: tRNA epoxyqueuosine(34) reductase QueG [Sandaracinaceae bacterium]